MSAQVSIIAIGELLVEFVSHTRGCALATTGPYSGPYPSGAPAIFLDQAARMGAATEMVGGLGDDGFGHALRQRLRDDGVGMAGVTTSAAHTTGVAFVSYYDDGNRDFIFHLTGTAADHFAPPPATLFDRSTAWLHVSAASLGNAAMRGRIMECVQEVIAAGGTLSCDPNARPELMQDMAVRDALTEVMANSHCLLPSTSDLEFLFPDLSEAAAIDAMLSAKAEIIALKRGADGATLIHGNKRIDLPGHSVTELDPTGAGDCFGGTFVALLAQGHSVANAGRMANAAGAIAVTRRGPMEGNSSPSEIESFLENSPMTEAAK